MTVSGGGNIAEVYGSGSVVFAEPTQSPFLHSSVTDSGDSNEATQLDLQNVQLQWFTAGAEFAFGSGVASTPAEGGTSAVVSVINGDVQIVSGNLPPHFTKK